MLKGIYRKIDGLIMGKRPYNTIFAFNYHNIRPIVRFLDRSKQHITQEQRVLLDVGAGASPYYPIFEEVVDRYIVVDMAESLPDTEMRPIEQKVGFAEALPIESASVDIVLSNQVLEHVLDERKAVEESFRVLKAGGLFIGSVPHISPIHLEPYDFRRFTYYGLKKILEDHQFEVIEIEGNGGIHRAMAMSLTMDWMLSNNEVGKPQRFNGLKHTLLFPVTGLINLLAILGDYILGDKKRSPSNYCWVARKK